MDLNLQKAELECIEAARDFARGYMTTHAGSWEMQRELPREFFLEAGRRGLLGLLARTDQGGSALSFTAFLKVMEELSYADMGAAFCLVVHNNQVRGIANNGTLAQIESYLQPMIRGEKIGAFLLTEAKGGSDAANIACLASPDGQGWRLNGEKAWITNARHADLLSVYAQTDPAKKSKGIACFFLEADQPGILREDSYEMLGGYATNAGGFRFQDCRVSADQVLAPAGSGFASAMGGIDIARACVAAMSVGMMRAALDTVMPRLLSRQAFGQPLGDFQGLQWQMADAWTALEASRQLAYSAAREIDQSGKATAAAAHAKKFATRAASEAITTCMQAMGADGLKQEHPLARHLAMARIAHYLDGTTEIQNLVLWRALKQHYS